ncbi:unnamed protein product [Acanthoscelides obtectus]|uniref:Uncharacterized protein n=1 Tax=Acanthoscelides obtectus TaxID=200917 RepID=A0A9P0K945_ACAOB|nr:unnamed protein product [Acanthoscelides obtectus]CAK1655349.1 hypothetical protein AOBTE_LOCUS19149 [Acanthoscelides obtectus]
MSPLFPKAAKFRQRVLAKAWKQKSEELELEYYKAVMNNQQSLTQAEENADENSVCFPNTECSFEADVV